MFVGGVLVSGPLVRRRTHAFLFTCFRLYSFSPFVLSPPGSLPLSCLCNFFAVYTIIYYTRAPIVRRVHIEKIDAAWEGLKEPARPVGPVYTP